MNNREGFDTTVLGREVCIEFDRTTEFSSEKYGADADGNRGEWRTSIDTDEASNVTVTLYDRHVVTVEVTGTFELPSDIRMCSSKTGPNGYPEVTLEAQSEQPLKRWLADHGYDADAHPIAYLEVPLTELSTEEQRLTVLAAIETYLETHDPSEQEIEEDDRDCDRDDD